MEVLDATNAAIISHRSLETFKSDFRRSKITISLSLIAKFTDFNVKNVRNGVKEKYFNLNSKQWLKVFV